MKKHLLLFFAALLPLVASAQTTVEIDGIWYNLVSKAKLAEVTYKGDSYDSYNDEYSGSITIPATITYEDVTYSVTSIGDDAFHGCSSLESITIPKGVTSIGNSAFWRCSSLTAITLPEGVTSIGDDAFYGCTSLTAITLPEGVTSIGEWAFRNCSNLTAITLPEGVTSIGNDAFYGCSSLTAVHISNIEAWCKIAFEKYSSNPLYYAHNLYLNGELVTNLVIPEGVKSIRNYAFRNCSSLTAITLPEGVTSIGEDAFDGCTSLTAITIPGNSQLKSIGRSAFEYCSSLTAITLPEGVTSIGDYAFRYCSSLTAITLPEGVTSIELYAFYGCRSLTAINIPEGVTSIGIHAFEGCISLTTIMLPKSVKYIYSEAFTNCSELTDVYCNAETVPSTSTDAFDGSYIEYVTLHVPTSAVNEYKNTAPWSGFGKVETLEITVDEITLSQSAAELIEGESLQLTATVSPDDAEDKSISWSSNNPSVATVDNAGKVTAIAPGTATITVTANDGSGVSAQCEVTVNELILGKCATPTISYKDGKVVLTCETEGAKVITTVANGDDEIFEVFDFELIPTYTITAYATKEHYENSDPVSLTICWVPCTEEHEKDDADGILTIPAKPVLIQCQGGVITVSGLADGTEVAVYTTSGTLVATATAEGESTHLTVPTGQVYIVKVADAVVKIGM